MNKTFWNITTGNSPVVATAIHNGHDLRDEVAKGFKISPEDRLREEDPYTGLWTDIGQTRIIGEYSRFQIDLNRRREAAVYIKPEDCWGLEVWKETPAPELVAESLREYDRFYTEVHGILSRLVKQFDQVVVLDLHTYNHRRRGPKAAPDSAEENPEINLGTGSIDRKYWTPVVDRFMRELSDFDFMGRRLDVRENIKFRGGYFSKWIDENFPKTVCPLAIEVKKIFMDEWTGKLDQNIFSAVHKSLGSTVPGLIDELSKMKNRI